MRERETCSSVKFVPVDENKIHSTDESMIESFPEGEGNREYTRNTVNKNTRRIMKKVSAK